MANLLVPRLDEPIVFTRNVWLKATEGYGVGRTSVIKGWKVLTEGVRLRVEVNGIMLNLPELGGVHFQVATFRRALRDLVPMSSEENLLCVAEATMFGTQLSCIEYYRYFPSDMLFDLVFTGDLCVRFVSATDDPLPSRVQIEEQYILSEHQIREYMDAGETIDQIRERGRIVQMTV